MTELSPNRYQKEAYEYAMYHRLEYPYLGFAEEVGEVANVVCLSAQAGKVVGLAAKAVRKYGSAKHIDVDALEDELGDCLWMIAAICTENELSLERVMQRNLEKLAHRKANGTIVDR